MSVVSTRRKRMYLRRHRRRKKGNLLIPILSIVGGLVAAVLFTVLFTVGAGVAAVAGVYMYFAQDLPDPESVVTQTRASFKTSEIYDRNGVLLYEIVDPQGGDRLPVTLDQVPKYLIYATVASEDASFYENPGFDPRGILRAAINNFLGGGRQGASSITQQLVRNVIMDPEERYEISYERKIREVILSMELARRYSKDQILEWYLNTNNYGNRAYGVEAAAQNYYGKHVGELTLAECAMLAAMPQSPTANSPVENPDRATKVREAVLMSMVREGYITQAQAEAAGREPLNVVTKEYDIKAPHFVFYVRQLLEEKFGLPLVYRGGLKIYTTLDLNVQHKVREIAREHVASMKPEQNVHNAAVVVLKTETGEIIAMQGSLDYYDKEIDGQVNVALAERQPGSSFKPFTYVTAFSEDLTPASMVLDVRTSFPDPPHPPYIPENVDGKFLGPLTLRYALANSRNIPALQVMDHVGVQDVLNMAHKMGINTLNREGVYGLSLTLGGGEVTLLDESFAFTVFANAGQAQGEPIPPERQREGYRQVDPVAILKVVDQEGRTIYEYKDPTQVQVITPQLAWLITDILSDDRARRATFGWESPLKLSRPALAKTGSTNNWRDSWTIGFTPDYCTGVWVGNSDNEAMDRVPGSRGAGPIWHNVMEYIHEGLPVRNFERPAEGLVQVSVCKESGLRPTQNCPHVYREWFLAGTEPTEQCNIHQKLRICTASGKLATPNCPLELVEEKVFLVLPPEATDWARENDIPQPPTQYCDLHGPSTAHADVSIIHPQTYAYVGGVITITGNARGGNFQFYKLEYGQGFTPKEWFQIGGLHNNQVSNGLLEYWDTTGLEEGPYTLQLSAVGWDGGYRQTSIQVTVDNTPPEVELTYPLTAEVFIMELDKVVKVHADATDNASMDRVEFYIDAISQPFGIATMAPFNQDWKIVMTTTHTETHSVYVIGYDSAGNSTQTYEVQFYVIRKPKPKKTSTLWNLDRWNRVAVLPARDRWWLGG